MPAAKVESFKAHQNKKKNENVLYDSSSDEVSPKLHVKQFPIFDGSEEKGKLDVDDWLFQVDNIYKVSGASERSLLQIVPRLVTDDAMTWFSTYGTRELIGQPWSVWQQGFVDEFRAPDYEERIQIENSRCRLQDNETVADYWKRRYRLVQKVYGADASDLVKIKDILLGLPSSLRVALRAAAGSNMSTMKLGRFRQLALEMSSMNQDEDFFDDKEQNERNEQESAQRSKNESHTRDSRYGNERNSNYFGSNQNTKDRYDEYDRDSYRNDRRNNNAQLLVRVLPTTAAKLRLASNVVSLVTGAKSAQKLITRAPPPKMAATIKA